MKPGTKLKSAVCDTEVMVIRGERRHRRMRRCPWWKNGPLTHGALNPDFAAGTLIGKRYVDPAGAVELLCVKPGKGSLSIGGVALQTKDAKTLPSSD